MDTRVSFSNTPAVELHCESSADKTAPFSISDLLFEEGRPPSNVLPQQDLTKILAGVEAVDDGLSEQIQSELVFSNSLEDFQTEYMQKTASLNKFDFDATQIEDLEANHLTDASSYTADLAEQNQVELSGGYELNNKQDLADDLASFVPINPMLIMGNNEKLSTGNVNQVNNLVEQQSNRLEEVADLPDKFQFPNTDKQANSFEPENKFSSRAIGEEADKLTLEGVKPEDVNKHSTQQVSESKSLEISSESAQMKAATLDFKIDDAIHSGLKDFFSNKLDFKSLVKSGESQVAQTTMPETLVKDFKAQANEILGPTGMRAEYQIDNFTARIKIYPPDLGEVHAKISIHNGQATLSMIAEDTQVKQLIETNLPKLKESFEQANINLADVNVSDNTQSEKQAYAEQKQKQALLSQNEDTEQQQEADLKNIVKNQSVVDIYA